MANHDISNKELLEFIQDNVAMKDAVATKDELERIEQSIVRIEQNMATKAELAKLQQTVDSHTTSLDRIAKRLGRFDSELSANNKRVSRLEQRAGLSEA